MCHKMIRGYVSKEVGTSGILELHKHVGEKCNPVCLAVTCDFSKRSHIRLYIIPVLTALGGGLLMYFSVRGRAAKQGIVFRIRTPGQGIIFVKICSMTGSTFVFFYSERPF